MTRIRQHLHSLHVLAAIANMRLLAVLGTACLRKFGEILNQLVELINAAILLPILISIKPRRNTREKIFYVRNFTYFFFLIIMR